MLIIPMKLWFGVEERSVYKVCSRGSKELFAEAQLLFSLGRVQKGLKCSWRSED